MENAPAIPEKMKKLCTIIGIDSESELSGKELGKAVANAIAQYAHDIGISRLGDYQGAEASEISKIAEVFFEAPAKYVVYQCEPSVERTVQYLKTIY